MTERHGHAQDPLLSSDPVEDLGARTAAWYDFQHNCALRLLLAALAGDEPLAVICEMHEDVLVASPGGSVREAVSVKHRDRNETWTVGALLREGGLPHLFGTWRAAERSIGARLMTNAHLAPDAERLRLAADPGSEHRAPVARELAAALGCEEREAAAFLGRLRLDTGLPHRRHMANVQAAQLLAPALRALGLPAEGREEAYEAALRLVAVAATDADPLDGDARLALLHGRALELAEREARLRARTVTSARLAARLREVARPSTAAALPRHREVHPVLLPRALVERGSAVADLRAGLGARGSRVVAVQAVGGEGKSTLAKQLLAGPAAADFECTFSFSFARGSPEAFLEEACRFFLPDEPSLPDLPPFAQARRLAAKLPERGGLLVLDEFERVLAREPGARRGRFDSREVGELLKLLLSALESRCRVLLTTRVVPVEIAEAAGYEPYPLGPLDEREAVSYLRMRGIAGEEERLAAAARRFFGHALTLRALAEFLLRSRWRGNIAGAESFEGLPRDRDGRLAAVLDSYAELLSEPERDVVAAIAASREGLAQEALAAVCAAVGVAGEELDAALGALDDTALLSREDPEPGAALTTHPLISDHFLGACPAERLEEIRRALAGFHEARMPPGMAGSVPQSRPGVAAFRQRVALRDWGAAQELYAARLPVSRQLFWAGHYRVCRSLTTPLVEAWRGGEHLLGEEEAAKLLLDAGCVEGKVTGVDPALAAFDEAAALAAPPSPSHAKALLYGAEVALEGGRCLLAEERLQEALRAGRLDAGSPEVAGRLGYAHACRGDRDRAAELLSGAIDASRDADPPDSRCLFLRVRADLAIRFGQLSAAHEDIDRALGIARPWSFLDYEGHLLRSRGDAHLAAGAPEEARERYREALRIGRESGYRWLQAEALIGLGRWALGEGEADEAASRAGEALRIAAEGGWWLERGRANLLRARATAAAGHAGGNAHAGGEGSGGAGTTADGEGTAADLDAAMELSERSGHHLLAWEAERLRREMEGTAPS